MPTARELSGFLLRALVAGLELAFVILHLWPELAQRGNTGTDAAGVAGQQPAAAAPGSYANAVDHAAPSVVSIYTTSLDPQPVDEVSQRMLGKRYLYRMRRDMGSGVIVSEDGYILTNQHVISTAQNIKVGLWDGRFAGAQVVGSDPETDLAVLKVKLAGLPAAPIASGPPPRVGDVVLAIGNSFGLSHTVTMGIISATGRESEDSGLYEGFIQTDAAINAGNSGGALVNANGELVGINTRHLGSQIGAQNIGFAIPLATARSVMEQIIEYGTVRRGWLGAQFTNLRPVTLPDGSVSSPGVLVRAVFEEGPAWNAGIRADDVIVSMDGAPVEDAQTLSFRLSMLPPGTRVDLTVERRGEKFETYATLIQEPPVP